ncbi:MAG TPA: RNA methyltransferase [Alphaproteobacteria bacterium]|nr:23S rRNA (guanosine(2251)-2'-O)-methyltransferase RlmB [Rhodospirillaceae bacterium]HRJ13105.1 RNA methyltransferase [Alphaproteobacteria bacterium]
MKKSTGPQKIWLYGWHAVLAAWANPARLCHRLLLGLDSAREFQERAVADASLKRPKPEFAEKKKFEQILGKGAVYQNIALEVTELEPLTLADLKRMITVRGRANFIMLDQVTDPHNVGAIMRSAAALGADAMILQNRHTPDAHGALAKVASGAVEILPICEVVNLSRALGELAEVGCVGLALDERAPAIHTIDIPASVCLVMGAEGDGLRPSVREACGLAASLPTRADFGTLNVSNAAAVALYECNRRSM